MSGIWPSLTRPNEITGANTGEPRLFTIQTPRTAHIAQFRRSAEV